ncbi:YaeP family protein [Aeromonas simiae]|uniref:YaeP family protein n=1 Tax=Aeromonas simiae TaxID=218936 RepID=UPI0005A87D97|nr:YaeP family protein [Aeromonas simiae]MDO2947721.1 YaeP family protein [Aeromonas simiae]MDO2952341.1 YaeP family protein [Aeromonas simiae]MDO2954936.1 YaeP family protein [Aeromonas simiae]
MTVYECCEAVRAAYSQIGSGDVGYVPKAIAAAVRALNAVASDERVPAELREQAAFAAANLLISDHQDA